jgi:hypothetical protein
MFPYPIGPYVSQKFMVFLYYQNLKPVWDAEFFLRKELLVENFETMGPIRTILCFSPYVFPPGAFSIGNSPIGTPYRLTNVKCHTG